MCLRKNQGRERHHVVLLVLVFLHHTHIFKKFLDETVKHINFNLDWSLCVTYVVITWEVHVKLYTKKLNGCFEESTCMIDL